MARKSGTTAIHQLLDDEQIARVEDGRTFYSAIDLVAALTGDPDPRAEWDEVKSLEPTLRARAHAVELRGEVQDAFDVPGVLRLIQVVDSPRAERLRGWLADAGAQRLKEEADPELAARRMRRAYAAQGRTRQWIDQRLRSISARQEVVGEWRQRGVGETEQYRQLTNKLLEATFGMDVNSMLAHKGFKRDLRDHMNDLELSLLSLAESTAASLHRHRKSGGMDQLLRDVEEAGRIVGQTREQIAHAAISGHVEAAA